MLRCCMTIFRRWFLCNLKIMAFASGARAMTMCSRASFVMIRRRGAELMGCPPVNTHGGNLNEGYIVGMTHIVEAVEQVRGMAINQVADAKFALVSGGPASLPVSSLILRGE